MEIKYFDIVGYSDAFNMQRELVNRRIEGKTGDILLLMEHPPVLVLGRGTKRGNILFPQEYIKARGIEIIESNRGGDVTYHCPGQLVGYPIIDLKDRGKDIHLYLRKLEQVLINLLKDIGVDARRNPGYTGVWAGDEKIASIGLAVKNWVAFHGFALNVCNNLDGFSLINPCGIKKLKCTSVSQLLGRKVAINELYSLIEKHFEEVVYNQLKVES
jgi:lipoyl(octanoyl) transferase